MKVKLDKVCKRIYAGGDVPKDRYSTVMTSEYTVPIYANAEKDDGLYGYTDTARENELSITVAARGTIGFTAIRREPFLPVVRLITVVPDVTKVSERYLYYALRSCKPTSSGTSIPQLTVPDIKKNEIELYSLPVQEKIADKLDVVVRIIALRQQELQRLDDLVKARFVELFGDGNHPHIALIDLIIEGAGLSYGIVQPGDDGTGDMGVLRPVDMVDGKISTASIKYIDRSIGDGFKKTELYGDELLITVRGTTGITALTDIRFNGMNVTRGIAVVRYDRNKINPVYLNAYLNTDESQRYIQEHTRGATLQQINLSDLRVQQIMVPPLALQEQMAAFIEQIDKSKVAVQKALDETQLLFDSLMQKYFG